MRGSLLLAVREGVREILSNKHRSLIATLAIILGVVSLFATFALSAGMAEEERKFLVDLGGLEHVFVEKRPVSKEQQSIASRSPGLTYRDIEALRKLPSVRLVSPNDPVQPRPPISYESKVVTNGWVVGSDEHYREIFNHRVKQGRFISHLDWENCAQVCVLGQEIVNSLGIPPGSATGKNVRISGVLFRVVGEFEEYPLSTAKNIFRAAPRASDDPSWFNPVLEGISVAVRDTDTFDATVEQMREAMLRTHHGVFDFGFNTEEDWHEAVEGRIFASRITGGLVAAVSLFVGGVGIANVMLSSLKQRMREIGVRRALGATGRDIFLQLMMETLMLGTLGGILGLVGGWWLVGKLARLVPEGAAPFFEPWTFLLSFGAALVVSAVAGLYPALRGARISPGSALRFE
jgi:putative ABC transport system permease protein